MCYTSSIEVGAKNVKRNNEDKREKENEKSACFA